MTKKQISKFAGTLVEHQGYFNALLAADADWMLKGNQKDRVAAIQRHRLLKIFKPICTNRIFTIENFDGWAINDAKLKKVFPFGVDPDSKKLGLNKHGEPFGKISPKVYKLQADFSFSEEWDKFFIWSQVVRFCEKYPKLFGENFYTIFPFKKGKKPFMASVRVISGGLRVGFRCFGRGNIWYARACQRLVVPQSLFS